MAAEKKTFVCQECGTTFPKWQGQCTACKAWNSIEEERRIASSTKSIEVADRIVGKKTASKPRKLEEIEISGDRRYRLSDSEFNRVLGGGLVAGSFLLLGGEPGIGKSTLILQAALHTAGLRTLYVSGEESEKQLKLRADRLGGKNRELLILCETDIEAILSAANEVNPHLLVIDSIQTIASELSDSSPGSPSQIKECANLLLRYAKMKGTSVAVVGHITKEGSIAGPKVLEHTVDTVLQFEGDKHFLFRILRCSKNRFGSTNELGIYEMCADGLHIIENPSEHFVSKNADGLSGRSVAIALEGIRPLLIETQALVSSAIYPNPQRSATGFDNRRMDMLLAVLEKRAGFKLLRQDVFLNIAGGLRINDPAVDISVLASVLSSALDRAVPSTICLTGEIGLSGEIRPVSRIEARVAEAERLGYKVVVVPKDNMPSITGKALKINVLGASNVEELFRLIFRKND